MDRRVLTCIAALAAALVLAACGSGGDSSTAGEDEAYFTAMDQQVQRVIGVASALRGMKDLPEVDDAKARAAVRDGIREGQECAAQLARLDPPEPAAGAHARLVDDCKALADALDAVLAEGRGEIGGTLVIPAADAADAAFELIGSARDEISDELRDADGEFSS